MPKERIPIAYTNAFKLRIVLDYIAVAKDGMTRKEFCRVRGVKRPTLQTWERKLSKLIAVSQRRGTAHPSRATKLTLGGSGRVSETAPIEDAVVTFIKDARWEEHVVTRDMIVAKVAELAPSFIEGKSYDAQLQWCTRFMQRNGLTIRRITHSGRKTISDLEEARLAFVLDVLKVAQEQCFDPHLGLVPKRTIFNMDQTSIYSTMGSRTTVDVVGVTHVPTLTEGSDSYRCTMAVTVAADGRKFPPHFVFQGQPGGDVEREVKTYCEEEVATFSAQAKAWFDLRVMLHWIENAWKPIVTEPSLLILDSLKVHKMAEVVDALACTRTAVLFVPGG